MTDTLNLSNATIGHGNGLSRMVFNQQGDSLSLLGNAKLVSQSINDYEIIPGSSLKIGSSPNEYSLPISISGASDGDVLTYNSTTQAVEFQAIPMANSLADPASKFFEDTVYFKNEVGLICKGSKGNSHIILNRKNPDSQASIVFSTGEDDEDLTRAFNIGTHRNMLVIQQLGYGDFLRIDPELGIYLGDDLTGYFLPKERGLPNQTIRVDPNNTAKLIWA